MATSVLERSSSIQWLKTRLPFYAWRCDRRSFSLPASTRKFPSRIRGFAGYIDTWAGISIPALFLSANVLFAGPERSRRSKVIARRSELAACSNAEPLAAPASPMHILARLASCARGMWTLVRTYRQRDPTKEASQ